MRVLIWTSAVVTLGLATTTFAQQPTRSAADVITAVGCVQRETDYRTQVADGKGGVAGTGVGAANEYVLRSARTVSSVNLKPIPTGDAAEVVYSLTGNLESEVGRGLGQQVAVSGYVEVAESDGTNKVKDLPRLNVLGWHTIAKTCPVPPGRK